MGFIIGSIAFVGGLWISLNCVDKVQKQLQGQINKLAKENFELKLKVIELEGKTNGNEIKMNGHEIKMNSVEFKTNMNEIELKYMKKDGMN
jgi:hypothetical protein